MPLTFDESTHSYFNNGIAVPSATRVLDHSGLVSYDAIRDEVLERKSRIGTIVHAATHFYDLDDLDWSSILDDEEIRNRVRAWISFRKDTGFVPRRLEERFVATVHGMEYGLTVDREGLLGRSECVVELKTSSAFQAWWSIQTAAYALGLPDLAGSSPRTLFARRRRIAVQLMADGRYKKFDFNDYADADVFISALHITSWKLAHGSPMRKLED